MKRLLRWVAPLILCLGMLVGCAPLTFSETAALDFGTYRAVRVVVVPSFTDAASATQYLADQLRRDSGFESVTTSPTDRVDLVLSVEVAVTSELDSDGELQYASKAQYFARNPAGTLVLQGEESDDSAFPGEAVEDALDEVALRFIRPYRL